MPRARRSAGRGSCDLKSVLVKYEYVLYVRIAYAVPWRVVPTHVLPSAFLSAHFHFASKIQEGSVACYGTGVGRWAGRGARRGVLDHPRGAEMVPLGLRRPAPVGPSFPVRPLPLLCCRFVPAATRDAAACGNAQESAPRGPIKRRRGPTYSQGPTPAPMSHVPTDRAAEEPK